MSQLRHLRPGNKLLQTLFLFHPARQFKTRFETVIVLFSLSTAWLKYVGHVFDLPFLFPSSVAEPCCLPVKDFSNRKSSSAF